ncbi:hypothetical protein CAOG_07924 [Capsaspora owczarzaki ATCC 30864]|uniref:EF-hand domain-containing protein n=1 Tax=Capsaspora owczarzaki (strain ATCC 30864) TaxID=595528 RepID=A0A0D2US94_CAPO3|nr:hypothetical protein CAOG_07924 [Capsaspora owczarzaki ATCC 30864]KJE97836.1 hypothetical protein, variant 1 [Capsaspora owczarzaki ATCC 30864]|eukprot:XP_004343009.1 hypothetical protein CAOG_07924 [Capsaspora owczarzaki ATCC 30864]
MSDLHDHAAASDRARLAPAVVEELTKAFAVCDKDGNGVITLNELGQVVSNLANVSVPDTKELEALMRLMDKNGDGLIELDEFIATMADWLQDDETGAAQATNRKRRAGDDAVDERFKIHRKVTRFLLQFRVASNFSEVRSNVSSWQDTQMMDFVNANDVSMDVDMPILGRETSSPATEAVKAAALASAQNANWDVLIHTISTLDSCESALLTLCELLVNLLSAYPTPADRRQIGEALVAVYEKLHPLIPRLVQFMQSIFPSTQWYSSKIVTLLLPGPRIANMPADFWMHSSHHAFKNAFVEAGGMPVLVKALLSSYPQVRGQALLCVGALARDHPVLRDQLLELDVLGPIQRIFNGIFAQPNFIVTLRDATWVLSVICGDVAFESLAHWHLVKNLLPLLAELLSHAGRTYTDAVVIINVCKCLAFLLPGVRENDQSVVTRSLVEVLNSATESRLKKAVLYTIGQLLVDENLAQNLLFHNLLASIRDLLHHEEEPTVRYAACKLLAMLSGARSRIQLLIDTGVVEDMITLVQNDKHTRKVAVRVLRNLTQGTLPQIIHLTTYNQLVAVLCHIFSYFLSKDEVLENVYNYQGPSFEFEILQDAVVALNAIIDAGQVEADEFNRPNPLVQLFAVDSLNQIGLLLRTIREQPAEMLNAFKHHNDNVGVTVEERIRHLLQKIKKNVDRSIAQHLEYEGLDHAAALLDDVLRTFFTSMSSTAKILLIKCALDDEIRVVEVPRAVTYEDFRSIIEARFGGELLITYKNMEGEFIAIDRLAVLERLMEKRQQDQAAFINVQLFRDPSGRARAASSGNLPSTSETSVLSEAVVASKAVSTTVGTPLKTPGLPNLGDSGFAFFSSYADLSAPTQPAKNALFQNLLAVTHFGPSELNELIAKWSTLTTDSHGQIDRARFEQGLREVGCTDPLVIEENFKAFDTDGNGMISFAEFVCGLSVLTRGTPDEKLALMFRSYDLDGNGYISKEEMTLIVQSCKEAAGEVAHPEQIASEVAQLFANIDVDGDERITLDEFKSGVANGALSLVLSVHGTTA